MSNNRLGLCLILKNLSPMGIHMAGSYDTVACKVALSFHEHYALYWVFTVAIVLSSDP